VVALLANISEIVQAKKRFAVPTLSGYRDFMFKVRVLVGDYFMHICEVQVHHRELKDFHTEDSV
jgi:hypothetical protein